MSQLNKIFEAKFLSNTLGNLLEWYDFTLHGGWSELP